MSISLDEGRIEYGDNVEHGFFAKDPVCGMDVEIARPAGRVEHEHRAYYFCSAECQQRFQANPAEFLPR